MNLKLYLNNQDQTEIVYHIKFNDNYKSKFRSYYTQKLIVLLSKFNKYEISELSEINNNYYEICPRSNFTTSWCSNLLSIVNKCGIDYIESIEYSVKYKNENDIPKVDKMLFTCKKYDENTYIKPPKYDDEFDEIKKSYFVRLNTIQRFSNNHGLGLDGFDVETYYNLYQKLGRDPTDIELYDLSQCNSEHARHWFFKGIFKFSDGEISDKPSLFRRIQSTYDPSIHNKSLVSFSDNASVIKGKYVSSIISKNNKYEIKKIRNDFSYKAETHNFPTGISPFPGAATGVGGRIRDTICVGKGGDIIAGTAGYCVGNIYNDLYNLENDNYYSFLHNRPLDILIEASDGASDYGNKIGEPIIQGFCRSHMSKHTKIYELEDKKNKPCRIEWLKPIMFSGGIGKIYNYNTFKNEPKYGNVIMRLGGPAYRIGLGGGTASSREQDDKNKESDFNAVQRGDPEMANKLVRFIRRINYLTVENNYYKQRIISIIKSIHDQGSGGMANVTREISEPLGANIYIDRVYSGDKTLSLLEKWVSEYQEQLTFLAEIKDYQLLKNIAKEENINLTCIGNIESNGILNVFTKNENELIKNPVSLPYFNESKKKEFYVREPNYKLYRTDNLKIDVSYSEEKIKPLRLDSKSIRKNDILFNYYIHKLFSLVDVGSKKFLTNKVDRSVSGLIVQQQCVGPFQLPLANISVVNSDYYDENGLVSAIGERPYFGISDPKNIGKMVRMTVGEMLTNMIWAPIGELKDINSVANWMWASTSMEDAYLLDKAVDSLVKIVKDIGFSINGGKDSLSMKVKNGKEEIKGPNTLVVSGYTNTYDFDKIIQPVLKKTNSKLVLIRFDNLICRGLGGSCFEHIIEEVDKTLFSNLNFDIPDLVSPTKFKKVFNTIQYLISNKMILSGHDISDGGLITTLCEMSISSNIGIEINIEDIDTYDCGNNPKNTDYILKYFEFFCNEELGIVVEIEEAFCQFLEYMLERDDVSYNVLGKTTEDNLISISYNDKSILEQEIHIIRSYWEETSYKIEEKQSKIECVREERNNLFSQKSIEINLPQSIKDKLFYDQLFNNINTNLNNIKNKIKPKVGVLREEGSNGDREMSFCLKEVGFEVYDITLNDIRNKKINLSSLRGLVFVGGFSYSDVLGSAYGWFLTIKTNKYLEDEFNKFYVREDTFSFGVCNGCQLMSLLCWVPKGITLEENKSERFESRYSFVRIMNNNSILLKNLNGLEFGIWVAHGEGRIVREEELDIDDSIYPIRYLDDNNKITEKYPFNPNGSKSGRAAICSENGRHLAMMPHPERCVLKWQLPWKPDNYKGKFTPWILIFCNAYNWCLSA